MSAVLDRPRGPVLIHKRFRSIGDHRSVPGFAHGCIAEVYNSATHPYFEMELHAPLESLAPGARASVEESVNVEPLCGSSLFDAAMHYRAPAPRNARKAALSQNLGNRVPDPV